MVEANFASAVLLETILADVTLCGAQNLATCVHIGPSVIDSRTLAKSRGLPLSFLRGCGLPDTVIGSLHPKYQSCFISYATKDQDFADLFYADLQAQGIRCWFAPHDIQGGRKIHEQIDEAIKVHDKLLLILSEASMGSNWAKTEIANACAKEQQQKRQMLFPISLVPFDRVRSWKLFDADNGIDTAREIREYFVLDFSNWKDNNSYAKAFDLLVRSLKAETSRAASGPRGDAR